MTIMTIMKRLAEAWLLAWFGAALVAQTVSSTRLESVLARGLETPRYGHWLGFDIFGRDLQYSVLHASLKSAGFALVTVAASSLLAVTLGGSIAMAPPRIRFVALRALDTLLAFPSLLLALAWAAIRGPGWSTLLISLLVGSVPPFVRLIYSRSIEILAEPYIDAARSLGASPGRILFRHLIPMLGSICAAKTPLLFAQALMAEATLSFLGVGAPIGSETWGSLLATGKEYLFEAPHIALAAGIPLTLTILALQRLAERLSRRTAQSS